MQNSGDNVFRAIPVGKDEPTLVSQFLAEHDFADNTRKAILNDLRKFARWFSAANNEPFSVARVTIRDVADFRDQSRQNQSWRVSATSTVNRAIVTLRRFFGWLVETGHLTINPAKPVKELRRQSLAPKCLARSEVRTLLREVELRQDVRAAAIFSLFVVHGLPCIRFGCPRIA